SWCRRLACNPSWCRRLACQFRRRAACTTTLKILRLLNLKQEQRSKILVVRGCAGYIERGSSRLSARSPTMAMIRDDHRSTWNRRAFLQAGTIGLPAAFAGLTTHAVTAAPQAAQPAQPAR